MSTTLAPRIESVPFTDINDVMEVVRPSDGRKLFVLKRSCDTFGIALSPQLRKLKKCPWATVIIMITVDSTGSQREHAMIPVDQMAMWLATINPGKVHKDFQAKLIAYQTKAAEVLDTYFRKGQAPTNPGRSLSEQAKFYYELALSQEETERRQAAIEQRQEITDNNVQRVAFTAANQAASLAGRIDYANQAAEDAKVIAMAAYWKGKGQAKRAILYAMKKSKGFRDLSPPYRTFGAWVEAEQAISDGDASKQVKCAEVELSMSLPIGMLPPSIAYPLRKLPAQFRNRALAMACRESDPEEPKHRQVLAAIAQVKKDEGLK